MANQLYGYKPSYRATTQPPPPGVAADATPTFSNSYSFSRSYADPFYPESATHRYLGSSELFPESESSKYPMYSSLLRYSSSANSHLGSQGSWSASEDPVLVGIKRSSEALYHSTLLGSHNTIGQTEAWYSPDSLTKYPRIETASRLPVYPQRPGEKDCAHYMLTRTCKYGDNCKFDHPIWVPEGGIPDWKEVPLIDASEALPERLGEPDCPYFLKTQRCKFGSRCKFNHPKDKSAILATSENSEIPSLPERPSEPICAFYMKTGICKFGMTCKYHHPKDIQIPSAEEDNGNTQFGLEVNTAGKAGDSNLVMPPISFTPALYHNSKGLPIRPGEIDCPFYLKTGSCKYGGSCRYNHPDRIVGHSVIPSPAATLNIGAINPTTTLYQPIEARLAQPMLGVASTLYPQRPGQMECDFYMKTGECKFGERCRFHHPIDRSAPTAMRAQRDVKLTLAGLPRREGAAICPYYMKTGTCKFGATCKFDHPPPGEVMAMLVQGAVTTEEAQGAVATEEADGAVAAGEADGAVAAGEADGAFATEEVQGTVSTEGNGSFQEQLQ